MLSTLLSNLPGMAYRCWWDVNYTLEFASEGCFDLTGYRPEDLVGNRVCSFAALIHPADRANVENEIRFAVSQQTSFRLVYRMTTAEGDTKWVWEQGRAVAGAADGQPPVLEGFITDITAQKRAEDVLVQRNNFLQIQQVAAAAAHEATTTTEALQAALDLVGAYTGWPVSHAWFRRDDQWQASGLWRIVGNYRPLQEASHAGGDLAAADLVCQTAAQSRAIVVTELSALTESPRMVAAAQLGLRGAIGVPVIVGERVVAVLEFYQVEPAPPESRLQQVLTFVASQVGRVMERTEAAEKLSQREQVFRALIENATDVITILEADGTIRYQSPSAERVLGYQVGELVGQNAFLFVHPDDLPAVAAVFADKIHKPGSSAALEFRFRHASGTWVPFEGLGKNLLDDPGIRGLIVNARDITERKRVERRLHLQGTALAAAANGITITDRYGTIVWVNPAFTQLTGYAAEEAIGKNPRFLKSGIHSNQFYRKLWETVSAGRVWRGEITNRHKNGSLHTEEMIITPVRDAQGVVTHFIAIKQDISDRKQSEEALRDTNLRLEQALAELKNTQQQVVQQERLRALGTMASGVAHDFNNALTAILGFSELLLNRPANLDDREKTLRYLQLMNTAAKDAGSVVNRLREFYRHREEGEVFTAINLNALVKEAVSLTQPRWQSEALAHGIAYTVATQPGEVPPLAGNAAEIREVLTNLIFNALDAMPQGGRLTLKTRMEAGQVILDVSDTGSGMTEEVRRRCFEPFFSTKGARGTGLGLSMVYGIINRHEGTIELTSAPGQGTTFSIRLPVEKREIIATGLGEAAVLSGRPLRVLLIEDEELVRNVLSEFMTGDGHTVATAVDGHTGLAAFHRDAFDLVLVDRAMPGLNGDQVAATIKSIAPQTPIILTTGFGSMMQAAGEKPAGIDLILNKPVSLQSLREALARVMRSSGS